MVKNKKKTMKALLLLLLPLVAADSYKETQNFQYSRTGEGNEEKKGFYGSQSGNMGGNFEVSHNMDTLAQRQMKGLAMTVGSQLGIDPHAIGTGAVVDELGTGSVYGSASTRGSAFGVHGVDTAGAGAAGSAGRYGTDSRRAGGQTYGSNSNYGSRTSGQRAAGSSYEEQARHGSMDSTAGLSSQSGYRQTAGRQGAAGGRYSSGSRYQTNANDYESQHGEMGAISGADYQGGATYYVPVTGVRQVGLDSTAAGSQYAGSGSRYHQSGSTSTAYEQSQAFAEAERQRVAGGTVVRPIVVRPGSAIRLAVRPGQAVPLTIPISVTPGAKPVYVRQNVGYGTNAAHAERVESASQVHEEDDEQRRDYGSDTYAQTAQQGQSWGRQSSSSHQEKLDSGTSGVRYTPGLTVGPVIDLGAVARNRDKLVVGGLELASEGSTGSQGSTVYNSGSRVASTGRQYGGSQTYGESQQRRYKTDASRQVSGETYDAGANSHGVGDSEGLGSQVYQVQTKPKSYQSSYSYEKSWEKQGTPYAIEPAGHLAPESGSLTSHNLYGQNSEAHNKDLSQMEEHGSRYGASSQRAASSSHSAGSQYGSSYDASRASSGSASRTSSGAASGASLGGSSHSDGLSLDMATMQQRLRDQMGKMCTDCGTGGGNTKGYSAHYSYSAQRSYGGADHDQAPDNDHSANQHRYRRGAYGGRYGSTGYYDKHYKPEVEYVEQPEDLGQQTEDFHDDSFDQKGIIEEKFTELTQKLKDLMKRIDGEQPEDLGQQTQGFSEIYHDSPKLEVESMMYQNEHVGQEDLGQQTENFYSPDIRETKLQVGNMGYHDKYPGGEPEDLGQQTQDYRPSTSFYTSQDPRLQVGSMSHYGEHLGQETEDLGQQTQGFSQNSYIYSHSASNLQLGSGGHIYSQSDRTSKPQLTPKRIYTNEDFGQEDLGQQTQGFSESHNFYSPSSRNPKLQVGSVVHHDEHLGQETQGFSESQNFYSPSSRNPKLQVGSVVHHDEHLGQETQGFSESQNFYSPSSQSPKLQVGSVVHYDEHLGQETEDLGQETQGFSESQNFYSPSSQSPKLQVGSVVHHDEHLGQETEGFSESQNFYSPSSRNPKLQVGSVVHHDEHLGQETEDLGQQTEDLSPKTEDKKSRGKIQSNIEYDDNKYVELEIGSILQQNEFFGRQPGTLQQKQANKPSDIDISQTSGNHDLPVEPDTEDLNKFKDDLSSQNHRTRGYINTEYKTTTDKNRRLQNTFSETNKLQDKVLGKTDVYKEHPKDQTDEAIESHLADIMAALSKPSSNRSKMEDIQAKYTEAQGNYINRHDPQPIHKEKPSVDIDFDGLSESSLGQEQQQYSGWDEHTQVGKEKEIEDVYRGHTKPKPLTGHSFLTTTHEVQEAPKEQEEKSFLDAFPEHLSKDSDKEGPRSFGTTLELEKDTNHHRVDVHVALEKSPEREDLDQEFDEGGQQTLETQWSPETFQQATASDTENNQQQSYKPVYHNQNTHNLLTLSANRDREVVEDLHQQHQEANFDNLQVDEKVDTLKEKSTDPHKMVEAVPTTTEKVGFWNKIGGGLGKAKDKAKSWFG